MHLSNVQVHAPYQQIAQDRGDFAILELPVGRITSTVQRGDVIGGAMADYSQITHGRATVGGYISRGKEEDVLWLREQPGIGYLSCPTCPGFPRPEDLDASGVRALLTELGIKYVVFNTRDFEGAPTMLADPNIGPALQRYIEDVLGLTPLERTDSCTLYRNPGIR